MAIITHSKKEAKHILKHTRKLIDEDIDTLHQITAISEKFEQVLEDASAQEDYAYALKHLRVCSCNKRAKWYPDSVFIHGTDYGPVYHCECGNYVSCHKNDPKRPMGFPADAHTRKLRKEVHEIFDPLWQVIKVPYIEPVIFRHAAYQTLSHLVGIKDKRRGHIGWFSKEQCRKAKIACRTELPHILNAFFRIATATLCPGSTPERMMALYYDFHKNYVLQTLPRRVSPTKKKLKRKKRKGRNNA